MAITQEQATLLKRKYQIDEVGVLAWEMHLSNNPDSLLNSVKAVLAGDSLMADRSQSEGGQPSVVPGWFYKACDLLSQQQQTSDTVEAFMRPQVEAVAAIAKENKRRADQEEEDE